MTYTQVWDATANAPSTQIILRDEDGAFIPFDDGNIDYQAFKEWLDEGNEPTPCAAPGAPDQGGASG